MFKLSCRNNRKICEICTKSTEETERCGWQRNIIVIIIIINIINVAVIIIIIIYITIQIYHHYFIIFTVIINILLNRFSSFNLI